jgi:lipoprotein-anchoring transpeptidase ErfK/SrfK
MISEEMPALPAHPQPTAVHAYDATVLEPAGATVHAGRGAIRQVVGVHAPYWGGPNVLLVLDARTVDGVDYVKVLLKRMPAETAGWVAADHVRLAQTTRRVVVDLSDRRMYVQDGGRTRWSARVVVGKPSTPTPRGQFAVDAPVDQPASSELGRRILAISAYSRALARYQGGIPQVAFHAYEKLGAPLGTASSHGCIRMATGSLTRLRKWATRGTPVLIKS